MNSYFLSVRHLLHFGGYPDINKNRMSVFLSDKKIVFDNKSTSKNN